MSLIVFAEHRFEAETFDKSIWRAGWQRGKMFIPHQCFHWHFAALAAALETEISTLQQTLMCGGGGGAQAVKLASHTRLAVCTLCRCKRKCVFLRTRWTIDIQLYIYIYTVYVCNYIYIYICNIIYINILFVIASSWQRLHT